MTKLMKTKLLAIKRELYKHYTVSDLISALETHLKDIPLNPLAGWTFEVDYDEINDHKEFLKTTDNPTWYNSEVVWFYIFKGDTGEDIDDEIDYFPEKMNMDMENHIEFEGTIEDGIQILTDLGAKYKSK